MFPTLNALQSYKMKWPVAIPSSRVNVSYLDNALKKAKETGKVAIPSSRVNVSYEEYQNKLKKALKKASRNPLKSGQCFLHKNLFLKKGIDYTSSQSPQVGSMFPTAPIFFYAL